GLHQLALAPPSRRTLSRHPRRQDSSKDCTRPFYPSLFPCPSSPALLVWQTRACSLHRSLVHSRPRSPDGPHPDPPRSLHQPSTVAPARRVLSDSPAPARADAETPRPFPD